MANLLYFDTEIKIIVRGMVGEDQKIQLLGNIKNVLDEAAASIESGASPYNESFVEVYDINVNYKQFRGVTKF